MSSSEAAKDCPLCPRLVAFRQENRQKYPDWFNGAVPSFGNNKARLLIVGLAPGLQGANRTGRPFTGDYAGDLLYKALDKFGFSEGSYARHKEDGLRLSDAIISNALRCVPPANKPLGLEIRTCRQFLQAQIESLENLQAILALGRIAHESILSCYEAKRKDNLFAHGGRYKLGSINLFSSYHCSRYNTNTGRLTEEMFFNVFKDIKEFLKL
ncbi:MAG: uracil-DNA glycosylase [Parvibaculales bacterium]